MSRYDTILHVYSATQSISKTAEIMGMNEQVVRRCIITAGIYSTDRTDEIARMKTDGMSVSDIMCRTGLCQICRIKGSIRVRTGQLKKKPYICASGASIKIKCIIKTPWNDPRRFFIQVDSIFLRGLFDVDKSMLRYVISNGFQFRSSCRINLGNISRLLSPFLPLQVPLVASLGRMSNFPCFSPTK